MEKDIKDAHIFYSAIQKYGWENFEHIILKDHLTQDEANYWEEYYIKKYNSCNNECGYNIRLGGSSSPMGIETKEKISNSNKGKQCSKSTKEKISKANKGKAPFSKGKSLTTAHKEHIKSSKIGVKFSDEHIQHLKKSHQTEEYILKMKIINGKKIQCIETGDIFLSLNDAAKWCGLSSDSSISDYLRGKQKSAGKHLITKIKLHWREIKGEE